MMEIEYPAWIEIDTKAVTKNYERVKELLSSRTGIMAVVKADAYGCGIEEMARIFQEAGASMLGVTLLKEAIILRNSGIDMPILVFAPLLPTDLPEALENDLTISISSFAGLKNAAEAAANLNVKAKIHLKIETGFGRTGFFSSELPEVVEMLKGEENIALEGVYTHFAAAGNRSYTKKQFSLFKDAVAYLEKNGLKVPVKHCCNSTAAVLYPEMQLDMVRIGTLLYGQNPAALNKRLNLVNPWQAKARILAVRKLPRNHVIGYGGDFRAKKDLTAAVIAIGYTDGFTLSPNLKPASLTGLLKMLAKTVLSFFGRGPDAPAVTIRGSRASILGRVGMQLSMVDVTDIPGVEVGEEITLEMRRTSASYSLPRVYTEEGEIYKIRCAQGEIKERSASQMS